MPNAEERLSLWQKSLPSSPGISQGILLKDIADKFELTGADILNILHYASLRALQQQSLTITKSDLMEGIRREFRKQDKTMVI